MFRHLTVLLPLLLGSCVAPLRVQETDAPLSPSPADEWAPQGPPPLLAVST